MPCPNEGRQGDASSSNGERGAASSQHRKMRRRLVPASLSSRRMRQRLVLAKEDEETYDMTPLGLGLAQPRWSSDRPNEGRINTRLAETYKCEITVRLG
ncbi:hypothetical protein GW17_00045677 [Ensete ventricosum]|nr:hypothetical protein GW17_00045677 [Ensete ventricosum]